MEERGFWDRPECLAELYISCSRDVNHLEPEHICQFTMYMISFMILTSEALQVHPFMDPLQDFSLSCTLSFRLVFTIALNIILQMLF